MGRRFSLEFGRKGPEGLNEEHDEGLNGAVSSKKEQKEIDIKKILDDLDSVVDDDFEDCKKDFSKELAKLMNDEDEIAEYYEDCGKEQEKLLEEAKKESDRLKSEIDEIFG